MTDSKDLDKQATYYKFLDELDSHTLDDAKNLSRQWVRDMLRSDRFVQQWRTSIEKLTVGMSESPLRISLIKRGIEARELVRQLKTRRHTSVQAKKPKEVNKNCQAQIAGYVMSGYLVTGVERERALTLAVEDARSIAKILEEEEEVK